MNKEKSSLLSSLLRIGLFALGFIIFLVAAFIIRLDIDMWRNVFIWVSIGLLYLAWFLPLVIPVGMPRESGKIFAGGVVYYRGAGVYTLLSAGVIVLVKILRLIVTVSVIAQAVVVLIFLVYVFAACFTVQHISNVENSDKYKREGIEMLRQKANFLLIKSEVLGGDKTDIKRQIEKFAADMRYLSPSEEVAAISLEDKMLRLMDEIAANPVFSGAAGAGDAQLKEKLTELDLTYKQRKSIY